MNSSKKYLKSVHRMGRMGLFVAALIMLGIPTVMAIVYDAFPGFGTIIGASIGLLAIFVPIAISEVLSYTPILGSAAYLTFITGNLMNLKIPAVLNAKEIANVEPGTEKADIISTIAVGVSSIVTTIIIFLGVLLLQPLAPVFELPTVQLAAGYVIPSLFGALSLGLLSGNVGGGVIIKGRMKAAIIPAILVTLLYFKAPFIVHNLQGVLIILAIGIVYTTAKFLYKRGKIQVILPDDNLVEDNHKIVGNE